MKKNIVVILIAAIISSLLLDGCYPGNVSQSNSDIESSNSSVTEVDATDPSHLSDSKVRINLSENEILSCDRNTAFAGIKAIKHKFDFGIVKDVFKFEPSEIINEELLELEDGSEVYHVTLKDGGDLAVGNGFIYFNKNDFANKQMLYLNDYYEFKAPSLCFNDYPLESLDDFSKEEALQIVQHYIEGLSIPVDDNPLIYAMDEKSMNLIKKDFDSAHPEQSEDLPQMKKNDEAYRICFRLRIQDTPIMDSSVPVRQTNESGITGGYCTVLVTRDGLQWMEINGLFDIDIAEAKEISICSAQEALSTVVENIEKSVISTDVYIDNLCFGYGVQVDKADANHYTLIPLWKIGSYSSFEQYENNQITIEQIPELHFVNPETGKER